MVEGIPQQPIVARVIQQPNPFKDVNLKKTEIQPKVIIKLFKLNYFYPQGYFEVMLKNVIFRDSRTLAIEENPSTSNSKIM